MPAYSQDQSLQVRVKDDPHTSAKMTGTDLQQQTVVRYFLPNINAEMHSTGVSYMKRKRRCGRCHECTTQDCGACSNCKDMKRFGGPGTKKKACIRRSCQSHIATGMYTKATRVMAYTCQQECQHKQGSKNTHLRFVIHTC